MALHRHVAIIEVASTRSVPFRTELTLLIPLRGFDQRGWFRIIDIEAPTTCRKGTEFFITQWVLA